MKSNSEEIIHVYARHGDDSGSRLSEYGVMQAENLAKEMLKIYAGRKPKLFTSPVGRAVHTAEIVGKFLGVEPESRVEIDVTASYYESRGFVNGINEDAIFISHQPTLEKICGRSLRNCGYHLERRAI